MKKFLVALLVIVMLALTTPALADDSTSVSCKISDIRTTTAIVKCLDSVGNLVESEVVALPERIKKITVPVPGPTITLRPDPRPTKVIHVPSPTKTVTVPGPTQTVKVPGKTKTVEVPGPVETKTITVPGPTVTATPSAGPVDTVREPNVLFDPPPVSTSEAVGYSALALFVLTALTVLGLWLGYVVGYKDKERSEKKFLAALRDQFYYKGEHS